MGGGSDVPDIEQRVIDSVVETISVFVVYLFTVGQNESMHADCSLFIATSAYLGIKRSCC
jgi:hypothetical protein